MFVIEEGSEAFEFLQRWTADPTTYKITVATRESTGQILLKRNEAIWTLPLNVTVLP